MFVKRPATLVYLDPPYLGERSKGYTNDAFADHEFHKSLLKTALSAKCMIFISGYDHEIYHSMLTLNKDWTKTTIDTITKDIKGNGLERQEVVWTNKYFQEAVKNNKLPLKLTKAEIKENKLNPERKK
jgi:DNA adenine methylase